jgi:hypothetical protein
VAEESEHAAMTTAAQLENRAPLADSQRQEWISPGTLALCLLGSRRAILTIARSRAALWLGAAFVISAALAREYDGEDLLHEPWHLLIPLVASLATSFLLYCVICVCGSEHLSRAHSFSGGYRRLLTLYWMTAPMAWLYAIPFERLVSPPDAVRANLGLLGIVAAWRVLLMTRVVAVLFGCRIWRAFLMVMLFADGVAVAAIMIMPRPIIDFMGGIRHTESEQVILDVTCFVQTWGILLLPIWLVGCLVIALQREIHWAPPDLDAEFGQSPSSPVTWSSWLVAAVSIAGWTAVLPVTQGEQRNRWRVTRDMRAGRIEDALRFMSSLDPDDFPPHWDPPPRLGYGEQRPPFLEVLDAVIRGDTAPWVNAVYLGKLGAQAEHVVENRYGNALFDLVTMSDEQLERYLEVLRNQPNGGLIAAMHYPELQALVPATSTADALQPPLSSRRRQLFRALQDLMHEYDPDRFPQQDSGADAGLNR